MNDITAPSTHRIHASNLEYLNGRIEKANRRAAKAGIEGHFEVKIVDTETVESENGEVNTFFQIELNRPELSHADWILAARIVIEEGGTVLRTVEGVDLSGWDRPNTHDCDACDRRRFRNTSYVVKNRVTGEIAQVGSDCLQRYTGITLGNIWILEYLDADELAELRTESEDRDSYGSNAPRFYDVRRLIAIALAVSNGGTKFVSRSHAREYGKQATSDLVGFVLHPGNRAEDIKEARELLETSREISEELIDEILAEAENVSGEYGQDLRAVAHSTQISGQSIGLLISVIACWFRATEQRRENRAYVKGFIGDLKVRLRDLNLTVASVRVFGGDYGDRTFIQFRTEDGHCVKWFASGDLSHELEAGVKVTLTGTVKEHAVYEDLDQTVLTRCKYAIQES